MSDWLKSVEQKLADPDFFAQQYQQAPIKTGCTCKDERQYSKNHLQNPFDDYFKVGERRKKRNIGLACYRCKKEYDSFDGWVESHSPITILLLCPKCFNNEKTDIYQKRCPDSKRDWEPVEY